MPNQVTNVKKLQKTERLIAVVDNGSDRRGCCDDCGAPLRYEYHTCKPDDPGFGGIYGCECIHAHIHSPDWMTFKARADLQRWNRLQQAVQRQLGVILSEELEEIWYHLFPDGSGYLLRQLSGGQGITQYGEPGAAEVITELLAQGWIMERQERGYFQNPFRGSSYWYCVRRDL